MTKTAIALLTVVFIPKTEHIVCSALDMSCVNLYFGAAVALALAGPSPSLIMSPH